MALSKKKVVSVAPAIDHEAIANTNRTIKFEQTLSQLEEDLSILRKEKAKLQMSINAIGQTYLASIQKSATEKVTQGIDRIVAMTRDYLRVNPIIETKYITGGILSAEFKQACADGWKIVGSDVDSKSNNIVHAAQRPLRPDDVEKFSAKITAFFKQLPFEPVGEQKTGTVKPVKARSKK